MLVKILRYLPRAQTVARRRIWQSDQVRAPHMPATAEDAPIEQRLGGLVAAWNRGDARAYAERYRPEGTFTNVNGGFYVGEDEFVRRHEEVLAG